MPAGHGRQRQRVALAVQQQAGGGAERELVLVAQRAVELGGDRQRVARQLPDRPHGEARQPRQRRRARALAGDVADDEHPPVRRRERVVEVAADLVEAARGAVERRGGEPGHGGQARRLQAALQLARDPARSAYRREFSTAIPARCPSSSARRRSASVNGRPGSARTSVIAPSDRPSATSGTMRIAPNPIARSRRRCSSSVAKASTSSARIDGISTTTPSVITRVRSLGSSIRSG